MSIEQIKLPDVGGEEVEVIEISVSVGDTVEEDDAIIVVETEKASMDIPAPFSGVIESIEIQAGDKISEGHVVCTIKAAGASDEIVVEEAQEVTEEVKAEPETEETKEKPQTQKLEVKKEVVQVETVVNQGRVYASPSIRRFAREYGVDLSQVKGSGRKNRIIKDDVRLYIKEQLSKPSGTTSSGNLGFDLPPLKEIDFSKFGEIEVVELSKIQKISGPSLQRNAIMIPHVTQFDEADITELEEFRKEQNAIYAKTNSDIKISPLVFAVKAVAKALKLHPNFNASLSADGQSMIFKKYVNVAVAVDTPNGLVVPVIKDADKKGFEEIAVELKAISIKAREGKLTATDMQGACFTISSLGGIGGTAFTPIVNAPEVAILGLSKSEIKPKYNGKDFEPRLMLPLSLSYDHRAIDGADGARFATTLSSLLGDIRKILL